MQKIRFFCFDFEIRIDLRQSSYLICQIFFSELKFAQKPMNNSLSASKKVKGVQSDSRLEKKVNKQTTEKFSASAENSLSALGRRWIFCTMQNFFCGLFFTFFSRWLSLWMPFTFFEADKELFTGFRVNFYSLKNPWQIKYEDLLQSNLISKNK